MRPILRRVRPSYSQSRTTSIRFASSQPPAAKAYIPKSRVKPQQQVEQPTDPASKTPESPGLSFYIFPFFYNRRRERQRLREKQAVQSTEPLDPERGRAAAERYVREGVVEERYRKSGRQVTTIICGIPIILGLGWILFERTFRGREQKSFPRVKNQNELR